MYKTVSGFPGSVIMRNQPLKFHISIVLELTGCRKCRFFCRKIFEYQFTSNYIEVIEDMLRYVKNKNFIIDR